jgi:hypothetical protein
MTEQNAVADEVGELRPGFGKAGRIAHLGVVDAMYAGGDFRNRNAWINEQTQRVGSISLPEVSRTAPISTIRATRGSRLVVSVSKATASSARSGRAGRSPSARLNCRSGETARPVPEAAPACRLNSRTRRAC